jgi:endonuclease/exonuclease/phosphatase family metal-dependent hydrolase
VTLRIFADRLLAGQGEERALVMLGDLNDEPTAATTQILQGPAGVGNRHRVRPARPGRRSAVESGAADPGGRRFSRVFRGRGELIDHLLVSEALVRRVERVDTGPGEPPLITEDPAARRDATASDHLPVVARFGAQ